MDTNKKIVGLKIYIKKNWGKKCEEFNISCATCQQYMALDILEENIFLEMWDKQLSK